MNRLDIFCFTSIARTKNFSATARELRISQQAVSKHIRNLETELGYPLFFRDRTFLELTKAGAFLLDYLSERADPEGDSDRIPLRGYFRNAQYRLFPMGRKSRLVS